MIRLLAVLCAVLALAACQTGSGQAPRDRAPVNTY
jgi:hypothetical protein